ncbi:hypothetical protein JI721_12085 [Alicyclobacillus cycloheptanicus]|uniref:Uncharacterized protein n=1 Tax=Alicyclobacillus cycloheptanicus TaxID=1457 RepID=A0ABT9XM17_9BACL|nr:hypothetical protein [Alicyclobacillus cycloheptanicus]MDQ0191267.1 hypothetical protein [Alicyclobacillus cycloheptanicus]WDM00457.1 hypothetical protein JI721_12085 [Alicyclobacillus cycloheptanicus]
MGYAVNHGFDIHINKELFRKRLNGKKFKEFYEELVMEWDLDITYPSFMNLLDNQVRWLLVYAYPVAKKCGVPIEELFVYVPIPKRDDFVKVQTNGHVGSSS